VITPIGVNFAMKIKGVGFALDSFCSFRRRLRFSLNCLFHFCVEFFVKRGIQRRLKVLSLTAFFDSLEAVRPAVTVLADRIDGR